MFGYFRFFLANLVLISHVGISLQGFNPGVAAVVSFYMLAGFVVNNLFNKVFVGEKPLYRQFYLDRALRIFPQYIFIVCLILGFLIITDYGQPNFDPFNLLKNILIIPLNYFMVVDNTIMQDPKWWLIPTAWSLGVELQAYLLLPFVIFYKKVKYVLACTSFMVFLLAGLGIIHTEYFGYTLLPGVLFIFILGTSIYKNTFDSESSDLFDRYFPSIVYLCLVLLIIILGVFKLLSASYVLETTIGIIIGLPIITSLARSKIKLPLNHLLGDLSYGIFLSHFFAMWIIDHYSWVNQDSNPYHYLILVFVISTIIAALGVFGIERNIKNYRFNIMSKK